MLRHPQPRHPPNQSSLGQQAEGRTREGLEECLRTTLGQSSPSVALVPVLDLPDSAGHPLVLLAQSVESETYLDKRNYSLPSTAQSYNSRTMLKEGPSWDQLDPRRKEEELDCSYRLHLDTHQPFTICHCVLCECADVVRFNKYVYNCIHEYGGLLKTPGQ
ncbi:hypothetical protein J4Q44_G00251600 [Coregonus suidteri]|uniref:Uncharacterized protein n=1 Tax=Coregonus suidteri TaxID=861788 RepID=A0AAN8L995_9TELE